MMREPSMLVRAIAEEQLEERQSDWAYSKPVVVLYIIWNFAFLVVAATAMVLSRNESPSMHLRLWIVGYALQGVLHMVYACVEYRKLQRRQQSLQAAFNSVESGGNLSTGSREDSGQYVTLAKHLDKDDIGSIAKYLESAKNTNSERLEIMRNLLVMYEDFMEE